MKEQQQCLLFGYAYFKWRIKKSLFWLVLQTNSARFKWGIESSSFLIGPQCSAVSLTFLDPVLCSCLFVLAAVLFNLLVWAFFITFNMYGPVSCLVCPSSSLLPQDEWRNEFMFQEEIQLTFKMLFCCSVFILPKFWSHMNVYPYGYSFIVKLQMGRWLVQIQDILLTVVYV